MNARQRAGSVVLLASGVLMTFALPGSAMGAVSHSHSPNFAGYQVNDAPKTGTVTFSLPQLTCSATNEGFVPSLVFTNFTTNEFTSAGIYVQCLGGVANYGSLVEINDHFSYLSQNLSSGDRVRLNITVTATSTTVAIADLTNHSTVKSKVSGINGGGAFTGASVGCNKIGSPGEPIAPFTSLAFTAIMVNGAPLGAGGTLFASDMYNGTTLQIRAGGLASTGTHFSTTFVAS